MNKVVSRLSIDFQNQVKLRSALDQLSPNNAADDGRASSMIRSINITVSKSSAGRSEDRSPLKKQTSPTQDELQRLRRIAKFSELRQKRIKSQLERLEIDLVTQENIRIEDKLKVQNNRARLASYLPQIAHMHFTRKSSQLKAEATRREEFRKSQQRFELHR